MGCVISGVKLRCSVVFSSVVRKAKIYYYLELSKLVFLVGDGCEWAGFPV